MIVAVGSVNLDLVVDLDEIPPVGGRAQTGRIRRRAGGMAANAAAAASSFGARVAFIGVVGPDSAGHWLLNDLQAAGVDVSGSRLDGWTSKAIVFVARDGQRTVISEEDAVGPQDLDRAVALLSDHGGGVLYLDGYRWPWAAETLAANPSPRVVIVDADGLRESAALERLCAVATVVLCSRSHWAGLVGEEHQVSVAESLANEYGATIVLTDGANGWWSTDGQLQMGDVGIRVSAVDTTGAGDVFAGVFAAAIGDGSPIKEAAELANTAAGLSTAHHGARDWLPSQADVARGYARRADKPHLNEVPEP